jgi:flagellar biosynthesis/type III secretory pathway protein FliH
LPNLSEREPSASDKQDAFNAPAA